jgi:hexokinase
MNTDAADRFLSGLENFFRVTLSDAREILVHFQEEMRRGLAGEKSSLKMIPSYVSRPKGTERGRFLALDLGGTNIRVLAVELDGRGGAVLAAVSRFVIPQETMTGPGEKLFDLIADCLQSFFQDHPAAVRNAHDLAFTFSFPVEQQSLNSGRLVCWTKGFSAAGVEGRDIVTLLDEALKRRGMGFLRVSSLANDTVGTLVAGSYADPACDMGVILGTGTNACYPEKILQIQKYRGSRDAAEMIVNMEWGGFNRLKTNAYDQRLDEASLNPGSQYLEKMVSGMYLGEMARLVMVEMIEKDLLFSIRELHAFSLECALTAEHLSMMAGGNDFFEEFGVKSVRISDREICWKIGRMVSVRSARIAAAAIAAVVSWMDPGVEVHHTIAVDGALFDKYPGYRGHMKDMLHEIFGGRADRIRLTLVRDGSGVGSAIIGAISNHAAQADI